MRALKREGKSAIFSSDTACSEGIWSEFANSGRSTDRTHFARRTKCHAHPLLHSVRSGGSAARTGKSFTENDAAFMRDRIARELRRKRGARQTDPSPP